MKLLLRICRSNQLCDFPLHQWIDTTKKSLIIKEIVLSATHYSIHRHHKLTPATDKVNWTLIQIHILFGGTLNKTVQSAENSCLNLWEAETRKPTSDYIVKFANLFKEKLMTTISMRQKDIRPAPARIEFKGMKFLITDRPSDATIQSYLMVSSKIRPRHNSVDLDLNSATAFFVSFVNTFVWFVWEFEI